MGGDKQWIQFGNGVDTKNRTEIPAVRVTEGVLPKGSIWTRNPIPACNDVPRLGGHNHECSGPMFTPPIPGLYGFGPGACASGVAPCTLEEMASRAMSFGIIETVRLVAKRRLDLVPTARVASTIKQVLVNIAGS